MRRAARVVLATAAAALPALAPFAGAAAATSQSRTLVTVRDSRITESSGLAASPTDPTVVWTVNDSGDSARAFAVSLTSGRTVAVLRERTDARDCEAMSSGRDASGRAMLWIGDIGDNRAVRTSVVLRLVREPHSVRSTTVTPVDLRVRYPHGPADAETLIWTHDGRLLIVTKELFGGEVLQVPPAAVRTALAGHSVESPALARLVGTVSQGLPTDGVALPDGRLVVRDYEGATVYAPPAYDGKALVPQARLSWPTQDQGETMAVVDGGRAVVVGSEGEREALIRVDVPAAPSPPSPPSPPSGTAGGGAQPAAAPDTGRWVGAGLVAIAVLTVSGVLVHVLRTRERAARSR
ncbi:MAG: hypothetical protein ACJ71T_06455 [Actinomycetales bacterium]